MGVVPKPCKGFPVRCLKEPLQDLLWHCPGFPFAFAPLEVNGVFADDALPHKEGKETLEVGPAQVEGSRPHLPSKVLKDCLAKMLLRAQSIEKAVEEGVHVLLVVQDGARRVPLGSLLKEEELKQGFVASYMVKLNDFPHGPHSTEASPVKACGIGNYQKEERERAVARRPVTALKIKMVAQRGIEPRLAD